MDVATLVKNITVAFEDAFTLVQRIRARKGEDPTAETEAIDDLLDSLSLGPTVVRGYYESDARRFGSLYTAGDSIAKEQLKDALINLQMTVLSSLSTIVLSEKDPDYDAIQAASDDCRVNVGVCLGQLSQRMSKAARGQNNNVPPKAHIYDNAPQKPVVRSQSHSTSSSTRTKNTPMTPPESDTEFLGELSTVQRPKFVPRAPDLDVMDVMHRQSYSGLYSHMDGSATLPVTQPKSYIMPPIGLESPVSPQELANINAQRQRDASFSSTTSPLSRNQSNTYSTQTGREGTSFQSQNSNWGYFGPQITTEPPKSIPYSELTSATLGKSRPSPTTGSFFRKPLPSTAPETIIPPPLSAPPPGPPPPLPPPQPPAYQRLSIAEEGDKEVYFNPPVPVRAMSRSGPPTRTSVSSDLQVSDASHRTSMSAGPITLPTEKNLMGFCKGAFRLQNGLEKKAFIVANRPLGYASMLQYWKCDKCYFEGQCSTIIPPGGKKPEKVFDPIIRDHEGIRYRWVFLAKCHVQLKSWPEGKRDGLYGSFCCIFCTAEAAQRGWSTVSNNMPSDRSSVKSSNSGNSNSGTIVFGNVHGFMEHLQMHRHPDFWPGIEMQGRFKCIVGRIAQRGEEFDINLLPY